MSKKVLIASIAARTELTQVQVTKVLDALPEALLAQVEASDKGRAEIPGVCSITKKHRAARQGHNPSTGAKIEIAAKDVLAFKPLGALAKI